MARCIVLQATHARSEPRWFNVAEALAREAARALGLRDRKLLGDDAMKHPQPPSNAAQLIAALKQHCEDRGYVAGEPATEKDGYIVVPVSIPSCRSAAVVSFNGEVFILDLPAGYHWTESAMEGDDEVHVLQDLLAFLDAYNDPLTQEVQVRRWLRGPRLELHLSNGAVLRRRGWSTGPPDDR